MLGKSGQVKLKSRKNCRFRVVFYIEVSVLYVSYFVRVCLICARESVSVNFRPPVLLGHEQRAGVCDSDVPLAVYGVQDLHCVPAAPPWGRDDVLRQMRPGLPHLLRGDGLHTYGWAKTSAAVEVIRFMKDEEALCFNVNLLLGCLHRPLGVRGLWQRGERNGEEGRSQNSQEAQVRKKMICQGQAPQGTWLF